MNVKYKGIGRKSVAGLLLCLMGVLTACEDDFGKNGTNSGVLTMKVTVPEGWTSGVAVDEEAPDSRCVSVKELSCDGGTKLYLHTIVADNPVEETVSATRGTPITNLTEFKKKYTRFSLSGICYNGEYPSDESKNEWTTEYAHDLYFSTETGTQQIGEGRPSLVWPYNDKVKFFAFVPTMEDFEAMKTGGSLKMSSSGVKGSPTLTYTVPTDVEKQIDLMTASADYNFSSTSTQVPLKFGHALTAVRIACGKDMLAGTISKVEISGIYGSGTQVIGSNKWVTSGQPVSYTISKEIELPTDDKSDDKVHAGTGTPITGTDKDNLTFILMPQTLPDGASITIEFTDAATNTERTITGSIAGHKWEAGTIITYSISPSSINIKASVEFNKQGATAENPTGDVMPYSGVWYDATYKAKAEIVQADAAVEIKKIPIDKISFKYKFENSETDVWEGCTTDKEINGLLQIAPQDAYKIMRTGFDTENEVGSEGSPISLTVNGKTANCYLVDKAGYFSLPLVYGNGNVADPKENEKSLVYYPKYDDDRMPADGKIANASDAVLCWQDAPDLIDPASVKVAGENLVFHIRKQTLTQGNALLAVRNSDKKIIWSWHIWVTPYKSNFYSEFYTSKPDGTYSYDLAKYNLGWCDRHDHNISRKFSLRAVVDMSAYGGAKETSVEIGTFTQDVFKGSDAGDNTYYQWGRKDPMLGGIYNSETPCYTYTKKNKPDNVEFTMENKQVFNQYNQDGYNYSFCKNPGDMMDDELIGSPDEASNGVTIGYAIQHPYMFVTNSREHDTEGHEGFSYRNHWHIDKAVPYLKGTWNATLEIERPIMFNAWNSTATDAGYEYGKMGTLANNAEIVTKSVYDPCPPEFQVPPIHALKEVLDAMSSTTLTYDKNAWTHADAGGTIIFPMTGVRNYALRANEWKTVVGLPVSFEDFYKISMPAFRMLTFVSSATIVKKDDWNAHQVYILRIDRVNRNNALGPGLNNLKKELVVSSNSYGLSVRPMRYADSKW